MNKSELENLAKVNLQKVRSGIITHQTLFDKAFEHNLYLSRNKIFGFYPLENQMSINIRKRYDSDNGWCSGIGKIIPELQFIDYSSHPHDLYFYPEENHYGPDIIDFYDCYLGYLKPFRDLLDAIETIDHGFDNRQFNVRFEIFSEEHVCKQYMFIADHFSDKIIPNEFLKNYAILS